MLSRLPTPFAVSAGTTQATSGTVVFSNSNGVSFGLAGNTVTASVAAGGAINLSAGTTSNNLTNFVLSNSNGVSFGLDGSTVTATVQTNYLTTAMASNRGSDFVQATAVFAGTSASGTIGSAGISVSIGPYITTAMLSNAATISNINASAGTTSQNLSALVFSNSNGVSFGLNGSTVTGSHNGLTSQSNQNVTAANGGFAFQTLSFSNLNGISFGTSAGSAITASHNALTSQSNQAFSAAGGSSAFQTLSFNNANGVSFSNVGGAIEASVAPGGGLTNIRVSAGTTSNLLSAVTFSNANGISFGLDASTVTASHNALTSQSNQAFSADGGSSAFQTLNFRNANGISFSNSDGSVQASYTVPSTAGLLSNIRVSAGTTSNLLSAVTFANSNGISFGLDASTVTASHNGLTSQSNQNVTAANGGFAFQTLSFSNANNFSFGTSAGSAITGSYTTPVVSNAIQAVGSATGSGTNTSRFAPDDHVHAGVFSMGVSNIGNTSGDTRVDVGRFVFVGGNNITLSQATAANAMNTITISAGAGGGGSQSIGASNLGNTSGTSGVASGAAVQFVIAASNGIIGSQSVNGASATLSIINSWSTATTVSNVASANAIGANAGRFALEGHQHAGVPAIAAGSNTGNTAGNTGSQHGTWVIAGTNNITVSGSTGGAGVHTLWLSAPSPGAGGSLSFSAGTSSAALNSLVFSNSNNMSFGLNGSTVTGSFNAINLGVSTMGNTAGTTGTIEGNGGQYILVGSNGVFMSQSTNGSTNSGTLTIQGWPHISSYENAKLEAATASVLSGNTLSLCVAFQLPQPLSASFLRFHHNVTSVSATGSTALLSMFASACRYSTLNAVVYKVNTGASSKSLISVASGSAAFTHCYSISVATNGSAYSLSQMATYPVEGGTTSFSTQLSATATRYSGNADFVSLASGQRFIDIPFATSLSPGPYWMVYGVSTSTATNDLRVAFATGIGNTLMHSYLLPGGGGQFGVIGSSNFTSGGLHGVGSFTTAGGGTTSALPLSAISNFTGNVCRLYFQALRSI